MTRELQIAVERAAQAAETDPLVEALEAMRKLVNSLAWEENRSGTTYSGYEEARAVLAKYAPDKEGGAE